MNLLNRRRRLTWRSVPVLLAGIIGGAAVLTPAMGSAAAFLTKAKADKRYLGNSAIVTQTTSVPASSGGTLSVNCPSGQQALSGGVDAPGNLVTGSDGVLTMESRPIVAGRAVGWYAEVFTGSNPAQVTIYVVCAP